MRTSFILLSVCLLLTIQETFAQDETSISLGSLLQTMPIPKPSLKQMMEENTTNEIVEKKISSAYSTIDKRIGVLYQPVYEKFLKVNSNSGLLKMTAAEQKMLNDVKLGARGLTESSKFNFFRLQMGFRLPIGVGRPMWSFEAPVASSSAAQKVHNQLKTAEASFNWQEFLTASEKYVLKFGSSNKSLDAINKKFSADMENLPTKKITISGIPHETPDPEKAILLCKTYGLERQGAFADEYNVTYNWWNQQYQQLRAVAESTDSLQQELNSLEEASRRSMQPFLNDLQIRTLEAMYKLTAVTQRLYNDRLIALIGDQQVKDMIGMYTQYKAGE